jgi:tetratricopeptide (TPR) repeat protein
MGSRRRLPGEPALFFLGALVYRGIFLADVRGDPLFSILAVDARSYFELASHFAAGDFLFGDEPLWFPPLYPAALGVLFRIFGPEPVWARLLQLLLGAATAALGCAAGRRISSVAGRVAGSILAFSPVLVFYENQLLLAGPTVFATALFLVLFLSARSGERGGFLAGLALGLLGLLRANSLVLLPVGALLLGRARGARSAATFVAGALLTTSPVLLRNGIVSGAWTPLTVNGGMIFATGFAEESLGGRALLRTPGDFGPGGAYHREAELLAGRKMTLAEASAFHRDRAFRRIRERPAWAIGLTMRKLRLLASAEEIDDNLSFSWGRDRSAALAWWPRPWALVAVAAACGGVIAARRRSRGAAESRALLLFAAAYAGSLLVFFVNARYRLPLLVPGAILAGLAADEILQRIRRRELRPLALPACAAIAASAFVLARPGVREDPALGLVAVGSALERTGDHAGALAVTERAIAIDPSVPGAHQNRAVSLLSLGRAEEALAAAEEATRLDEGLAEAWMTQGTILARAGRIEEALPRFRRAAELAPENADALGNLAQALALSGRTEEAVAIGRRAVARGATWIAPGLSSWEARADSARAAPGPESGAPPRGESENE